MIQVIATFKNQHLAKSMSVLVTLHHACTVPYQGPFEDVRRDPLD